MPRSVRGQELDTFFDPCEIDVNWFEPIACGCDDEPLSNTGWYFNYSRMKAFVSRPQETPGDMTFASINFPGTFILGGLNAGSASDANFDGTWGNQYDLGFRGDSNGSVFMTFQKIDNPRVTLFEDQVSLTSVQLADFFLDPLPSTFVTQNAFNYYSFELNRSWTLANTGNGVAWEPIAGLRYIRFRDHSDRRDYTQDPPGFPVLGPADGNLTALNFERIQTQNTTTDNDMFGGQLGMRSKLRRGRWVLSTDVRAIGFHNFRSRQRIVSLEGNQDVVTATYGADASDGIDGDGNGIFTGATQVFGDGNEAVNPPSQQSFADESGRFVYGGQFGLDAAFEITRGFALNLGGQLTVFGDGVGRGVQHTDDSLVIGGLTFGMSFNR